MNNESIQQTGIKLEQLDRELKQFGKSLKDFEQFLIDNDIKRWATIDQFGQFWYEERTTETITARVPDNLIYERYLESKNSRK